MTLKRGALIACVWLAGCTDVVGVVTDRVWDEAKIMCSGNGGVSSVRSFALAFKPGARVDVLCNNGMNGSFLTK